MLSDTEQRSDTKVFWDFLKTNFRTLFLYAIAGAAGAFLITCFIPKEYKSYGIVYPPSSTSIENSIDFPNFGYDVEADRLMQIFESREIRDSVIKKFDLENYFEIKRSRADWHDELVKRYYKNITLERTTSMAVMLTARTKDPELSAAIVNFIINSADRFREKIYKKNIIPAYENAAIEYEIQKKKVDSAEVDLLAKLKESNLSSLLMLMSDAQISIDIDKLNAISTASAHGGIGPEIIAFKSKYEVLKDSKSRMVRIRKSFTNPIPKIYVINYAEPQYKKISPSFTINMAIGAIFSLCMATIILLVRENSANKKA
jgi:capsular polysaccharide biosynthesis protein